MAAYASCGKIFLKAFKQKSLESFKSEHNDNLLRNLTLFDLLCIGVGATVGSGVFVLTGFVANQYAGPAVVFSWLIAGLACCCSAMSYAELSCRIPSSGSAYSYVYLSLGEWPAYLAAWCLTLECGISSSAVARSWGVKFNDFVINYYRSAEDQIYSTDEGVNIYAGMLELMVVIVFLCGVDISKFTINLFTVLKMFLVLFMIVAGFSVFQVKHVAVFAPMGFSGIMRGATSCFFGFVGYDEVCCMASETVDPHKNLPYAIFGTIFIVTVFYCLSSLALVGMTPFQDIDVQSGFSIAFKQNGLNFAAHITAVGELLTLPLVVLVSFIAQPRLQLAMSHDGLLPKVFSEIDVNGNLFKGILISGMVCVIIALLVPFSYLDDMISAGVLFSFNLTNMSLILLRRGKNDSNHGENDTYSGVNSSHFGATTSKNYVSYTSVVNSGNSNYSGISEASSISSNYDHHQREISTISRVMSFISGVCYSMYRMLTTMPRMTNNYCKDLLIWYCIYSILAGALLTNLNFSKHHNPTYEMNIVFVLLPLLALVYIAVCIRRNCPEVTIGRGASFYRALDLLNVLNSNADELKYVSGGNSRMSSVNNTPIKINITNNIAENQNNNNTNNSSNNSKHNGVYQNNVIEMSNLHLNPTHKSHSNTPNKNTATTTNTQNTHNNNHNNSNNTSEYNRLNMSTLTNVCDSPANSCDTEEFDLHYYKVPYLPFIPLFGIFINFYLICQLSFSGLLFVFGYFALATVCYVFYGLNNSNVDGKSSNFNNNQSMSEDELNELYYNNNLNNSNSSINLSGLYVDKFQFNGRLHTPERNGVSSNQTSVTGSVVGSAANSVSGSVAGSVNNSIKKSQNRPHPHIVYSPIVPTTLRTGAYYDSVIMSSPIVSPVRGPVNGQKEGNYTPNGYVYSGSDDDQMGNYDSDEHSRHVYSSSVFGSDEVVPGGNSNGIGGGSI